MTEIRFVKIEEDSRPLLENLWQLYFYDLDKFRGKGIGEDGKYPLGRLPLLFTSDDRIGYFFFKGSDLVGFSIIRGLDQETKIVSEFFILGSFQHQGLGKEIALKMFSLYPGKWELAFQESNTTAAAFWRNVVETASPSNWLEEKRPLPDKPDLPADNWISFTSS